MEKDRENYFTLICFFSCTSCVVTGRLHDLWSLMISHVKRISVVAIRDADTHLTSFFPLLFSHLNLISAENH